MRKDTPTYQELQQDATTNWRRVSQIRDTKYGEIRQRLQQPWRCPSCGTGGLTDPICQKCRSARIVELD